MCTGIFSSCNLSGQERCQCSPAQCFCTHPTQSVQAVCGTGATATGLYGCATGIATGNLPLTVASAAGAALSAGTAFTGMGGMACVNRKIKLHNAANRLEESVIQLRKTNADKEAEISTLSERSKELSANLDRLQMERSSINAERKKDLKRIEDLTHELVTLRGELVSIQQQSESIRQQRLIDLDRQEKATASLGAENKSLKQSVSDLTTQVSRLGGVNCSAATENKKLQSLLLDLHQQEDALKRQIDHLLEEKAALQNLVRSFESESELQRTKIEEGTREMGAIQQRLEELQARLSQLGPEVLRMNS